MASDENATWRNVWKRPSIILPTLTALVAIVAAFVTLLVTINSNNDTERGRERSAFALAAAEVVMNQATCKLGQARARTLITVFPQLKRELTPLTRPNLSPALCNQLRHRTTATDVFVPSWGNYSTVISGGIFNSASNRRATCIFTFGHVYKPTQLAVTVRSPRTHKQVKVLNPCFGVRP